MDKQKKPGIRAALFPVLSGSAKEKRAVSILLACMEQVPELAETLLRGQGAPLGKRSKIEARTEVGSIGGKRAVRPDGKIIITSKSRQWTALVEAKIGKRQLGAEQIEAYLGAGRTEGVDALITISNDFAVLPTHHPTYEGKVPKGISLLHWSWGSVLTKCELLTEGGEIENRDHRWVVEHLVRFLDHPSTGVMRFDRMPVSWKEITAAVGAGAVIRRDNEAALEAVAGWVQKTRDLGLQLTRKTLLRPVPIKLSRAERTDPAAVTARTLETLCNEGKLEVEYDIPDGVSRLKVTANLQLRTLTSSMTVGAPEDRKTAKACTNWLLRTLTEKNPREVHIKAVYGGRRPDIQEALDKVRKNPNALDSVEPKICPKRFEVRRVSDLGERMEDRKKFVQALQKLVPEFYDRVGKHLRPWVPSAPRVGSTPASNESSGAAKKAEEPGSESFGG